MIALPSALDGLVSFFAAHGLLLVLGVSGWLILGAAAVALARSPIHQVRLGELTLLLTTAWLGLALVPLERPAPLDRWLDGQVGFYSAENLLSPGSGESGYVARDVKGDSLRAMPISVDAPPTVAEVSQEVPILPPPIARTASRQQSPSIETQATSTPALMPETDSARPAVDAGHTVHKGQLVRRVSAGPAERRVELPFLPTPGQIEESPDGTWATVAGLIWLSGAALSGIWLVVGQAVLVRWRSTGRPADDWLRRLYATLAWPAGRARPALLVSPRCDRPVAFGIWRPTILLPCVGCHPNHSTRLRHVLLHELGHILQRDAWGQSLFNLLLPLLWFHPLYWWLRGRVHLCRELLADDWAASQSNKESYARELIGLIKGRAHGRHPGLGALAVFQSSTEFYRRMTMLLERNGPLATACSWTWRLAAVLAGVLAVVLFSSTLGLSASEDEDEDDSPTTSAASDDDEEHDDEYEEGREEEEEGEEDEESEESDEVSDESEEEDGDEEDEGDRGEDDDDDEREDGDEVEEDDDEGDDEGEEREDDDEEQDGDERAEEEMEAEEASDDDESDLAELQERREGLAQELEALESRINETNQTREERRAQREWLAQQESKQAELAETEARIRDALRSDAEELEQRILGRQSEELGPVLEKVNGLLEEQERLRESLESVTGQVDELRQERDALAAEVAELREALNQVRQAPEEDDAEER